MENPAVANALYWLGWMTVLRNVAAGLVLAGVGFEFVEGWLSDGWHKTVDDARAFQIATLNNETERLRNEQKGSNVAIAKANERASKAAEQAEAERLARVQLEAKIAPRRIEPADQVKIGKALSAFHGQTVILRSYMLDAESAILGQQIIASLHIAGIQVDDRRMSEMASGAIAVGVHVVGTNPALVHSLLGVFAQIGKLGVSNDPPPPPTFSQGGSGVYGAATLFVGIKPITG